MAPAPKLCPAEQEQRVLSAAAYCIEQSSLFDFTMSNIAKHAGMSMGSVYKHIHTKEDVLVALASKSFENLHRVFSIIFNSSLSTPERLIGVSLLDFNKIDPYPFSRHLEMLTSNDALLQRVSPSWKQKLQNCDEHMRVLFQDLLQSAVDNDELRPTTASVEFLRQLQLGIWAINVGYIQVTLQMQSRAEETSLALPPPMPDDPHILNTVHLINSYPWRENLDEAGIDKAMTLLQQLEFR